MNTSKTLEWVAMRRRCRAFTLIELLTVVAIIALLIGILIPSLSKARDSAKKVKTQAAMKSIGDALANFVAENERDLKGNAFPASWEMQDPTEDFGTDYPEMWGAQTLVRYLLGKDMNGYVSPRSVSKKFWNDKFSYEQKGWYEKEGGSNYPQGAPADGFARSGPYLSPDGVSVKAPKDLPGGPGGSPVGNTTDPQYLNPVFVDTFDMPICYWSANSKHAAQAKPNIATEYATNYEGIYHYGDNAIFTGGCVCFFNAPGQKVCICVAENGIWDFGNGQSNDLGQNGKGTLTWPSQWTSTPPTAADIDDYPTSFAYYILNREVYESSGTKSDGSDKSIIPVRRDSFLLISPGKDGLFGTSDDISNF